jgi:hypothetical protein
VRTNHEYIVHEFVVELHEDESPMNNEPEKCSELVWCDPTDLPQDVSDVFRFIIEQGYIGKQPYLEFGYNSLN